MEIKNEEVENWSYYYPSHYITKFSTLIRLMKQYEQGISQLENTMPRDIMENVFHAYLGKNRKVLSNRWITK